MTWLEDVRTLVETMPQEFHLRDLEPYYGGFKASHPDNKHIAEKVRQILQNLVASNEIERLEPGLYRRTGNPAIRLWPLRAGEPTNRAELAKILGMDGIQGLGRGMFKLRSGPHNRDLLLFQQAEGPYHDKAGPRDGFIYVGMGQKQHGDQKWEGMNRYLGEHLERGITPHLFRQTDSKSANLEYVGEVVCEEVQEVYIDDEQRVVFEYLLVPTSSSKPLTSAFSETLVRMKEQPSLEPRIELRNRVTSRLDRYARNRAFAVVVRQSYGDECAICGTPLARGIYKDLQGAHVRSVAAGGPDEINNGICLCARHHWAFDRGVFTLDNEYKIRLHKQARDDPHGELADGKIVATPDVSEHRPHPTYLAHHRATFGFPPIS